jgi:hypothetical protein
MKSKAYSVNHQSRNQQEPTLSLFVLVFSEVCGVRAAGSGQTPRGGETKGDFFDETSPIHTFEAKRTA